MMDRRGWLCLLASGALAGTAFAQQRRYPTGGRQRSSDKSNGAGGQSPDEVLMRFPGMLKSVTKKQILMEMEGEQELVFRRTKRTQFFDGDKEAKETEAPVGTKIVIEGRRELNGDLDAIHVIWNEKPVEKESR